MRPTPKRLIKIIFFVSSLFFVLMNINFLLREADQSESSSSQDASLWPIAGIGHNHSAPNLFNEWRSLDNARLSHNEMMVRLSEDRMRVEGRGNASRNLTWGGLEGGGLGALPRYQNLSDIRRVSWEVNRRQAIRNLDKFDLISSETSVVIVVQVHNRTEYLRYLVDSLRKATDMDQTLLIFSHDFYSTELNDIVASIDFCLVMQIFYPYSMQLHPNEYPGEDPRDCPRNINKQQAMAMGCRNKEYPDKYGHYREAKYSQTKLHWFWKINHVFDFLDVTQSFSGPMLFIEEDHYLVEDFVSVLRMMFRLKTRVCVDCNIITLGTYDKKPAYGDASAKVEIMNWVSSKHNMGMALTRQTWEQIKACTEVFCRYDDYNWDWSLHHVGMTCVPSRLRVMVMKSPRIFHIGECGLHSKGKNCNPADRVRAIESLLGTNRRSLHPPGLVVGGYPTVPRRVPKPNGGWGDVRDREMCSSFSDPQTHR